MSYFSTRANPMQREAIRTTEGPLLIIAGPGSGKTFTLVERIVYLITEKAASAESLFVVTFTNKAAQELTTRISDRLNEIGVSFNLNEMYLGTFHSICLRWLEEYRPYTRLQRHFTLMDQFDQQYFLYQHLQAYEDIVGIEHLCGPPNQGTWRRVGKLLKSLNLVTEEALSVQTLIDAPQQIIQVLGQCVALYRKQLEEANALDFSMIQYEALQLLRSHSDVLHTLRSQITYIMVDEYQDTNTIQEMILTLLAGDDSPNLCVVGDDDQSLYRFRGATVRNILQFADKFPTGQCHQVTLTVNYRSHPDIIQFYNHWIEGQEWQHLAQHLRLPKIIVPRDEDFPTMPTVVKLAAPSQAKWHEEVLVFLRALRNKGQLTDWNQVAFLFRSVKNDKVVALARYLEDNGIPVYSPRSNQFFEREEVRLMIGCLIFLFPQFCKVRERDDGIELSIWNYYDQECCDTLAQRLQLPENQSLLQWIDRKAKTHLDLTQNTNYSFSGLFYELLRFPLFSCYLDQKLMHDGAQMSRAMHNLAFFSQLLNKFEYLHHISILSTLHLEQNLRDLFNQFLRYLKNGGLNEYEDKTEYAPSGHVSFLTVHQSKGLEFPVVVVGSLGAVPRKQHTKLDEILEHGYLSRPSFEPLANTKFYDFRRLYYTAFSRAQNLLVLASPQKSGRGRTPSKYFAPYFDPLPSWRAIHTQLTDLPLAKIKDIHLKVKYSFTGHLTLFENCPEQYRFFKELDFAPARQNPILFGTLVHQTIEDIHQMILDGQETLLSEELLRRSFENNYIYLTKRERAYLSPTVKHIALSQILHYYERHQNDWSHIQQSEIDISLVKDNYILTGQIDLIQSKGHSVELVDFKSEKKPDPNDPKDYEKLDRYRRQLEVYAHIISERTAQSISQTHLYYTGEEEPYITFRQDQDTVMKTIATFDEVVTRIEAKDFRISERPTKLCKDCDMQYYCDSKEWAFKSK